MWTSDTTATFAQASFMAKKRRMRNSHRCGATTEDGSPCRNLVSNDRWRRRCPKHRLFGSHGWANKRRTESNKPTERPRTRSAQPPALSPNDRWVTEVDRRGRALAGPADWDKFAGNLNRAACRFLADLANALSEVRTLTKEAVHDAIVFLIGDQRPPVRYIAEKCADKIIASRLGGIAEVIRSLRVLGIFSCVMGGYPMTNCRCLTDWWRAEGKNMTKTALKEALPEIA